MLSDLFQVVIVLQEPLLISGTVRSEADLLAKPIPSKCS